MNLKNKNSSIYLAFVDVFFLHPGPIDYAEHVIKGLQEGFAG